MKITFIEELGDTGSRFAYTHHKLKQAGYEVGQRSPRGELPDQTDVLILAGLSLSAPRTPDNYPVLAACGKVQAQLRLVLTDDVADGVLGPEWVQLSLPLNPDALLAVIHSRVVAALTETAAK